MQSGDLTKTWALVAGAILVLVGILGFFPNPIVGSAPGALVATDTLHNIVHLGTGILALAISRLSSGDARKTALIGFGALYAAVFVLVLMSPNLFGLFAVPANAMDHLIHASLAVLTLGIAFMARGSYEPARA
ncbi:MAG TPA: DUF4383 domain-containing protein [Candidatus Limnocylindrales bacterium]|nr:DUF4383 domain-containing protein [Candidatus Limnocylindrales bacterium]